MPTTASIQLKSSKAQVPTGVFINNEWVRVGSVGPGVPARVR